MKTLFALAASSAIFAGTIHAAPKVQLATKPQVVGVPHPAPDFPWIGAGGKTYPAKGLRGQPMVILVAPSPDTKGLRQEVGRIQETYLDFAARKAVFFEAFTGRIGRVESNVQFAIAQNRADLAAA